MDYKYRLHGHIEVKIVYCNLAGSCKEFFKTKKLALNLFSMTQQRGQVCSLFAATPTTSPRKEPMQQARQAPQRLSPPDRPGRTISSTVFFSSKGDPPPTAASLLLLRAGDIKTKSGPHCYACNNPVRHGTSPLRCSTVSHKQFACSGLHRSNMLNRWLCPTLRGPRATETIVPAINNSLRQLPTSYPPRHQAPCLRGPGLPGTGPRCEVMQRCCDSSR